MGCDVPNHDENCNCDENIIEITTDNDEVIKCLVIDIFEVDGYDKEYIALTPLESEEVYFYIYDEDENGNVELTNIEDDEEFEFIGNAFLEMLDEDMLEDEEDTTEESEA